MDEQTAQQFKAANKGGNLTSEQINIAFRAKYGLDAPQSVNVMKDFVGKHDGRDPWFLERVMRGDWDKELREKDPSYLQQAATARNMQAAQRANMQAIQPAMQSYEQQLPEIAQKFATTRGQIEAEKDPLMQRYENILADIKGVGARAEQKQGMVTSREMSRRGITGGSLREQEISSAVEPITMQIGRQLEGVGLERESGLRNLQNLIANLTSQETEVQRAVRNAMAQLQAQAGMGGVQQGIQAQQFDVSHQLALAQQRLAEERQRAEMAQANVVQPTFTSSSGVLFDPRTGEVVRNIDVPKGTSGGGTSGYGGIQDVFNKLNLNTNVTKQGRYEFVP